jgi:hypothetical protein
LGNVTDLARGDSRANNLGQVFACYLSLLSFCRKQAGRVRIFEVEEVGDEDISGRSIARITASVAELDEVMAEFDRSEPEDR